MLEIIKGHDVEDLATLNIQSTQNWYGEGKNPLSLMRSHETIISVLEGMMPDFHERLKNQTDLLIPSEVGPFPTNEHAELFPNDDPVLIKWMKSYLQSRDL